MSSRSNSLKLFLLLGCFFNFGCASSQSDESTGAEAQAFEIFIGFTDKQVETKAWANCATIYSLHERALKDSYPAIAQIQHDRANGAKLAIIMAFSLHFLFDENVEAESRIRNFEAARDHALTYRNDWLELAANRFAALNEISVEEFSRVFGEELDECVFNLDGQDYYIELARELAIRFGSDEG
jgi:hypothetical protein